MKNMIAIWSDPMPRLQLARRRDMVAGLAAGLAVGSLLLWSGAASAAKAPDSFADLARRVTPAVVNIQSAHQATAADSAAPEMPFEFPEGSPFEKFFKQFREHNGDSGRGKPRAAMALGSGFIIDASGYVVTNNHVIDGASDIKVKLGDDKQYAAKLIGADPQTDLALLKIEAGRPLPTVSFGDSDKAEVGDWVLAVGNPFGLGGTVTAGIVSARNRNIDAGPYDDFLQIDASINKGNSGGPLFNLDGKVIGVNAAIYSPNGGSVGIGFSIPSNLVSTVVAQLRANGKVERGWLGVRIQKVTPEIAGAMGLGDAQGALVTDVTTDSPAAKAGLRRGDVILDFAGKAVGGSRELARIVASSPAGSDAKMTVWRDGERATLDVTTGRQPAQMAGADEPATPAGTYRSAELNADLAALDAARRGEMGIAADVDGVVVVDLAPGAAFDQGLRPGDVIREVSRQPVTSPQQVETLMDKARSGPNKAVLLLINRRGQDLFLGLRLGLA